MLSKVEKKLVTANMFMVQNIDYVVDGFIV